MEPSSPKDETLTLCVVTSRRVAPSQQVVRLAECMLALVDFLVENTGEYEDLRDRLKPVLDAVAHKR